LPGGPIRRYHGRNQQSGQEMKRCDLVKLMTLPPALLAQAHDVIE
jgi:hypothetical protein